MKEIILPLFLMIAIYVYGEESKGHSFTFTQKAELHDFDAIPSGFSFKQGRVLPVSKNKRFPSTVDFIFDLPHGIGCNNENLDSEFSGLAGVLNLGPVDINTVNKIPNRSLPSSISAKNILAGNVYLFLTADGKNFGLIKVTEIDMTNEILKFVWRYPLLDD